MIKYLIKFVPCRCYAEKLVQEGQLFMHTSTYYHDLERQNGKGQGDLGEASVFPGIQIYKNMHYPIYCMYTVDEADIENGNIRISDKVLQDFHCESGYLVLIDYEKFIACLNSAVFGGFASAHGSVIYGTPTRELSAKMLCDKSVDNLFIKRECFQHQKEYRIVVYQVIHDPVEKRMLDGMEVDFICGYAEKSYYIHEGLGNFSTIVACESLQKDEHNSVLDLSKI